MIYFIAWLKDYLPFPVSLGLELQAKTLKFNNWPMFERFYILQSLRNSLSFVCCMFINYDLIVKTVNAENLNSL